jgi:Uncharacterised nucleotidyltransferase
VAVAVENEVGPMCGNRRGQSVGSEEGPDDLGLADERRGRGRVVKEHDAQVAGLDRSQSLLEGCNVRGGLGVHLPEQRLPEIGQLRVRKAPHEPLGPDDADGLRANLDGLPAALQHDDSRLGEHVDDLLGPVRMPVVVPEDAENGEGKPASRLGQDRGLVRLAERRQIAGEEKEVSLAFERCERLGGLVGASLGAVDVRGSGDTDRLASHRRSAHLWLPHTAGPTRVSLIRMPEFDEIAAALKKTGAALRDAGVPFMLGGTLAAWVRGGPSSDHDLDYMLRPEDAERALAALVEAGLRPERPPEEWLLKAWDGDILVDLIFRPVSGEIGDEEFERAEVMEVLSQEMAVMALEDVLVAKLLAIDETHLEFKSTLELARAVREQVDWDAVRARTESSPFARAFLTLAEELEVIPTRTIG